ncbi:oxysterol-binding protein 1 [Cajanus cajan]|uniref:oxysterol-binding protein 1 n=1 Tax=Cajanus cajan TaxID=3821 RepID=UPI00098D94F3|nr:oxysterol-binding protein 1 [Cajanus cajan]
MMAFRVGVRRWILTFALLYVCIFGKNFGNADEDESEGQTGGGGFGGVGAGIGGAGGGVGGGVGTGAGGGGFGAGGGGLGAGGGIGGFGAGGSGAGGGGGGGGGGVGDPSQIFSKALLCFNDKNIYRSCEESCRLSENGNLNVPAEKTDIFCQGPCLSETNLVLSCLDNVFSNFVFYNKATIQDIRKTIEAGCGYGPQRGDFNVAEHIQADESKASKANRHNVAMGLATIAIGRALLPLFFT